MVKKPSGANVTPLSCSFDMQGTSTLSDTTSLSLENFIIGRHGITQSPLQMGEISTLRVEDLAFGQKLGRGASSKVYLAQHVPSGKLVAVKVLQSPPEEDSESRRLVMNEVRTVFEARSDHLVSFYDAFLHEGNIQLVLEYMDMGSLEGMLRAVAGSGLPEAVLAHVLWQIMQGLTYLHRERHSVHRDLKPANVLLNSRGFVKLSDFGISKQLGSTQALAGTYCGTAAYMSPERIQGEHYSFASDIWSVGIIALECALGSYPYPRAANYFDIVTHVVHGPVPTGGLQQRLAHDGHGSHDLLELIHATLNKDPQQRPDAVALARHPFIMRHRAQHCDLGAWLRGMAAATQPPSAEL